MDPTSNRDVEIMSACSLCRFTPVRPTIVRIQVINDTPGGGYLSPVCWTLRNVERNTPLYSEVPVDFTAQPERLIMEHLRSVWRDGQEG